MKLRAAKLILSFSLPIALARVDAPAQQTNEVLTNASDVLALPADRALSGVSISVKGVVTAAEKYWEGRFFVHDASGGVFVDSISSEQPEVGDVVEVSGISHPGAFAPVISKPTWKKMGTAPLPPARTVAIDRLMSGIEDGQRIEITGLVRTAVEEHSLLSADLVSGGYRLHVFAGLPADFDLQKLIGAEVRVRGTAAASFNAQLRQLITVKVFAPLPDDFLIEKRESFDPFEQPVLPLTGIAQYHKNNAPGKRVHVKGVVTYQRVGEDLFLMGDGGGLHVKTRRHDRFESGETVEAVGFPSLDHYLPVLEDAVCRRVNEPPARVVPERASAEELQAGLHHASLITLQAKLMDRVVRRSINHTSEGMQVETVMMLQADNLLFSAEAESLEEPTELVSASLGSTVDVTGVCLSEIDEEGRLKILKLLLPPDRPLRVLQTPSWFTPQHLSISLAVVFIVLLLAMTWTVAISRKNSVLKVVVCEKEQAQEQLRAAHRQLEERVKQRTEQLKQQITARQESELHFKAVLTERTRLAQELHDTLEQTLTGIALQMDTATRLVERKPADANHHLNLARSLVSQGQLDVRRSVWDLRSRVLEQFDLPGALAAIGRRLTDGSGVRVDVAASGHVRPLPDLIEDNLLRIAQEALTNVIKHADATTASIELDYRDADVSLTVKDNGRGFATDNCAGPLDGHFGLLGISERVKRINGQLTIHSAPEAGTTVRVEIPIHTGKEDQMPIFAGLDV